MKHRLILCLLVVCALPAAAQTEDDQMDDHERQDRRYYERYLKKERQAEEAEQAEDPHAVAEAYVAQAEGLIRDRNYNSFSGEHYRVQTDDPRVDPKAAVAALEAFREYFNRFWSSHVELRPYDTQSRVFLFYSFYKYNQLLAGDWRFSYMRPAGHYRNEVDALTMHTDVNGEGAFGETLIHESAHQLINQRIYPSDVRPIRWVSEGLASYFGYTRTDADGMFLTGEIGGITMRLLKDGKPKPNKTPKDAVRIFRKAIKSAGPSDAAPFSRVVGMTDPADFYSNPAIHYMASWLLVHYLLHAEGGRHIDAFEHYMQQDAKGQATPELLYLLTGMDAEALDLAVTAYLKKVAK